MKNKKVYIGISAIVLVVILTTIGILYIKSKNNDVKVTNFAKTEESTKEAMKEKEEITNENLKESEEKNVDENVEKNVEENTVAEEPTEKNKEEVVEKKTEKVVESVPKKEFTVTDTKKTMYVTATSLNVRSGPETTYNRIGSLKNSSEASITGVVNGFGWYRISYNGKVGYIDGTYVSDNKPVTETVIENNSSESTKSVSEESAIGALIVINSRNNTLRYYVNGKLARSYSCATGKSSSATPQGKCKVVQKIVNRPYYKTGIPGGDPRNPLGKRWMGLNLAGTGGDTYGIHGTNNESSIGTNASHGCIRMHNADVESFYDVVSIGTTVIIKNTSASDKEIAAVYGIYIE